MHSAQDDTLTQGPFGWLRDLAVYFTTMFTSLPGSTMDFTTVLPAMNSLA